MKIIKVKLDELIVNKDNDRHGETADYLAAMHWLLKNRADHMRKLTKDIVSSSEIYEPPLVHNDGEKFTVFDGNRRVTCLKLLDSPSLAPTKSWRTFFQDLRKGWKGKFPEKIECQIENNLERIEEILYRRHTGAQNGVGQVQWDVVSKKIFVNRTGKKIKIDLAEEIENKLKYIGSIGEKANLPHSVINRLLSSELFRNKVGITLNKGHIEISHDEEKVFEALTRIAEDSLSKQLMLGSVWDKTRKLKYLNDLGKEGILPSASDVLDSNISFKTLKPKGKSKTKGNKQNLSSNKDRKTLIRKEDGSKLSSQAHTKRVLDIWVELQHQLKFGIHNNAIAVLFRVLLEFSIQNYIDRKKMSNIYEKDSLRNKYSKVVDHMYQDELIEKQYRNDLKKFGSKDAIFSSNTLNSYVHHKDFFPSDHHLKSMWDNLANYVEICLEQ